MTHKIEVVWKKTSPELEQEITRFWVSEKALSNEAAAMNRVKQSVCIARNEDGVLIAVSTAHPKLMPRLRQLLYYYRTFVGAAHRNSKSIYPMSLASRQALQEYTLALAQPECIGAIVEFENKALGEAYQFTHDEQTKSYFFGYSPKGLKMHVTYFEGVQLQTPEQVKAAIKATGAIVPTARG